MEQGKFQEKLNGNNNQSSIFCLTIFILIILFDQFLYPQSNFTVRDEFNSISFSGNDGTHNWTTDWIEINESNGPSAGDERVITDGSESYVLRVRDNDGGGEGVMRQADISGATSATLSFNYRRIRLDNANDYVTIDISMNGGLDWIEIDRLEGPATDVSYLSINYDITSYASANMAIRFLSSSSMGRRDRVYFDNVQIDYQLGLHNWSYQRPVSITNNSGRTLSDYQVMVVLTTTDMGNPYTHVNNDGSDIRFSLADSSNPLPYWIESWNNSGTSIIWVKIPSILQGTNTPINLYYGNPLASSESDGVATFCYFDDFEDHNAGEIPDGWNLSAADVLVQEDGLLKVLDDGTSAAGINTPICDTISDCAVRQRFRATEYTANRDVNHAGVVVRYMDDNNLLYGGFVSETQVGIWQLINGVATRIGGIWNIQDIANEWHTQELMVTGDSLWLKIDDNVMGNARASSMTPSTGVSGFHSQFQNENGYRDWHLVRKYSSPDPIATIGFETFGDYSLPVELIAFEAVLQGNNVILQWQTASEIDNARWYIDRKTISRDEYDLIASGELTLENTEKDFIRLAIVEGQGSKTTRTDYEYIDKDISHHNVYAYRLADVSFSGEYTYHDPVVVVPATIPLSFELGQNYPNPFNPRTTIKYQLPLQSKVTLKIFNILGQEVITLIDKEVEAGFYEISWDGKNNFRHQVASGVYIYRILAHSLDGKNRYTMSKRMNLLR